MHAYLHVCLCAMCVSEYPQNSQEGTRLLRTGIPNSCEHHVGSLNQTLVLHLSAGIRAAPACLAASASLNRFPYGISVCSPPLWRLCLAFHLQSPCFCLQWSHSIHNFFPAPFISFLESQGKFEMSE